MLKRSLCLLLTIALVMVSCTTCSAAPQKFSHYFFGTFDTIITLIAYTDSEETFQTYARLAETEMRRYHQIFDLYNPYEGVANLYEVNHNAASGAVKAEPELIELLLEIQSWQKTYGDKANPAMGSVLALWHDSRTYGLPVPADKALQDAAAHTNYEDVVIDKDAGTIAFLDDQLQLDLGAVAKGHAAQLVADQLREAGLESFILNAGGNVVSGGAPLDNRPHWNVAIEGLDGFSTKVIIGVENCAVVTSGDYQRYYEVEGKRYHHLIDPVTLFPSTHLRAVTIIHPDSGLADFLSTTLFLMPYEEGRALVDSIPELEAMWTLPDESVLMTDGFAALIQS